MGVYDNELPTTVANRRALALRTIAALVRSKLPADPGDDTPIQAAIREELGLIQESSTRWRNRARNLEVRNL